FSVHYFEYMSNFAFAGEAHDFWEFLYVDKGEVNVSADDVHITLKRGEVIFHKPNEFHSVQATENIAPNVIVISFSSSSPAMHFFENQIFNIDELERSLLANIINETRNCFSGRLDDPYLTHMNKKESDVFGSEQMLRLLLEYFLIHLARRQSNPIILEKPLSKQLPKTTKSRSDHEVFNRILNYLEMNLHEHLSLELICRDNLIGRSQLQRLFQEKTGNGVIEYFSKMKIDAAKQLIRTDRMNFTQIAQHLGYSSIHYFSRQFKKITGMTPSEYASSIKSMTDRIL
ncbi:MAG: helix-turn-helix domain-containing protein, partial [Dorea sp.]